jgi:hypothetical protein
MIPDLRTWTREEIMKRVTFFKNLKGSFRGNPEPSRHGRCGG